MEKYKDIIDMPHPTSVKHPRMDMSNRAAQFSPFAAMVGHDVAIRETARLTDKRIELDESEMALLDGRLQILAEAVKRGDRPEIVITHFVKDPRKEGGAYERQTGFVTRIDMYNRSVVMNEGRIIKIDDIMAIDGDIFL